MNGTTKIGMKILAVAALTLLSLAPSGNVHAAGPGTGRGHGPGLGLGPCDGSGSGHRMEMLAAHLELSEEQTEVIENIMDQGREKNVELRKELMRLSNDLQGEMLKDEPSEKDALDLVDRIGAVRTEIRANRLKNRLEMREVLTPEQRDKMLVMHERSRGAGGGRRGHGPHGDGDCDGSGPRRGRQGNRTQR